MSKLKVLFMIDSLTYGGAERSLVNLLARLDYDKVDVSLLMVTCGCVYDFMVPSQVTLVDYQPFGQSAWQRFWFSICRYRYSLSLRLNRLHRRPIAFATLEWQAYKSAIQPQPGHYDVAIAYQQGFPTWYVAEKVNADRKYAWINNDYTKDACALLCVKSLYDKYDGVVAVSDALRDIILRDGLVDAPRLRTIYDIIDTAPIVRLSQQPAVGFAPNADVPTIVTVGRLDINQKGQDLCVEASAMLKQRGVRHQWCIVGDGPHRCDLETMAKARGVADMVRFVGMQLNPYPYMRLADVYVQPSRYEGFGLTIAEAKLLGCAIVCTDFPSAHNQIEHETNGLIVPMSAVAIADAAERLLANHDLRHRLQSAAKAYSNNTVSTEPAKVMSLIGVEKQF